jgi:hypothetical protein
MTLTGAFQRPPFASGGGGGSSGKSKALPAIWRFLVTTVELGLAEITASTLHWNVHQITATPVVVAVPPG